ncbi:hypothetical protein [Sorangium sp. So ce341]|uniref:hypothetical protein n=1 Tax=Sorangium sp. So ce341 TaxID=3133302 RepID=UPI003F60DBB8
MKPVQAWQEECNVWRSAWRQVETFVERIEELRDRNAANAALVQAVLPVVEAIHDEKRWREGRGLDVSLETAIDRGDKIPGDLKKKETFETRVPGQLEIEGAVASLFVPGGDVSADKIANIQLPKPATLFDVYSETGWSPWVVPLYPTDTLSQPAEYTSWNSFFPPADRLDATQETAETYPKKTWSELVSEREPPEPSDGEDGWRSLLDPKASSDQRKAAAARAQGACQDGILAYLKCHNHISKEGVGNLPDLDADAVMGLLTNAATELARRSPIYASIAGSGDPDKARAFSASQPLIDAVLPPLSAILDEAIGAQIAYPDGPLRMLRTLESAFRSHWVFRKIWFSTRRARYADPLLRRVLLPFRTSLARLRAGNATLYAYPAALGRPAAHADALLSLAPQPGGGHRSFPALEPGHIAVVEGARRTLAVVLGSAGPGLPDGDNPGLDRLHVAPLFVSMAQGPGIMGLLGTGTLSAGPLTLTDAALRHATDTGHPEHDGALQSFVSLWSKLCLLLGTAEITSGADKALRISIPCPLNEKVELPVDGPVPPGAQQLVLDVTKVVEKGLPKANPAFARVGEMLLVKGIDEHGEPWQGACEVIALQRVAAADVAKPIAVIPPKQPVCCDCAGEKLVLLVTDYLVPVPLVKNVVVHRTFEGFGAPSLAAGRLLPNVVDPATKSGNNDPYRGPELATARRILERWLSNA